MPGADGVLFVFLAALRKFMFHIFVFKTFRCPTPCRNNVCIFIRGCLGGGWIDKGLVLVPTRLRGVKTSFD